MITYAGKSKNIFARTVEREIKNINAYEHKWKIKTNTQKFTLLPIATRKLKPVTIDNTIIPYAKEAKILGLKLGTSGYSKHIKDIALKDDTALTTLKIFSALNTNIKLHLVKTCVLPILTYPTYALNAASRTQIIKLQRKQNKALRFAFNERYPYTHTTAELHTLANIQPINTTLYTRGNHTKHTLTDILQDTTYISAIQEHEHDYEHSWFRKAVSKLTSGEPAPLFTL